MLVKVEVGQKWDKGNRRWEVRSVSKSADAQTGKNVQLHAHLFDKVSGQSRFVRLTSDGLGLRGYTLVGG